MGNSLVKTIRYEEKDILHVTVHVKIHIPKCLQNYVFKRLYGKDNENLDKPYCVDILC